MAEAFARLSFTPDWHIASAGIEKHGLNPYMLQVMAEAGIDMSAHYSKTVDELPAGDWELLITVCSHAEQNCPHLAARRHIHLPFDDPPALAKDLPLPEALAIYRRVRDEILQAFQNIVTKE